MIDDQDVRPVGSPVVLVIDGGLHPDDEFLVGLTTEGFRILLASSGEEGLSALSTSCPDVVVVGSDIPDLSTHAMLRLLHEMEAAPILAMSVSDDENEVVLAFELGAVDFLSRPGRVRESTARIWSALRLLAGTRHSSLLPPEASTPGGASVVAAGPVEVDLRRREVRVRGHWVHARPKEIELLYLLVSESGSVVTRERAFDALWPHCGPRMGATLDAHIRRLRYVVEEDRSNPRHIVTVRGYGHRFDP